MWRNLKFLHVADVKKFRFLHICHVDKSEISPHDRFFSTDIIRDIRDKYEVCVIFCISNRGVSQISTRICDRLAKCTSREALLSRKASLHMYPNIKPIGIRDQNYAWVQVVTVKKDKIELNLASQQVTTFPVELALHSE